MSMRMSRPHPRSPLVLDTNNAYARLGVSPLASVDEIKTVLNKKRREALELRRDGSKQALAEAEREMERLQDIEKDIGTPARRTAYDAEHPQNELLTVQPSPRDRVLADATRLDVVTRWLADVVGAGAMPTMPMSGDLIAPEGIDSELASILAPFEKSEMKRTTNSPEFVVTLAEMGNLDGGTTRSLGGNE
jgi:hypothetical protein